MGAAAAAEIAGVHSEVRGVKRDLAVVRASVEECRAENMEFFESFTANLESAQESIAIMRVCTCRIVKGYYTRCLNSDNVVQSPA